MIIISIGEGDRPSSLSGLTMNTSTWGRETFLHLPFLYKFQLLKSTFDIMINILQDKKLLFKVPRLLYNDSI